MKSLDGLRRLAAVAGFVSLAGLAASGFSLMTAYVPSEREAFDSVLYLRRQGGAGALSRALHYWLASAAIVSSVLYLLCAFLQDAARRERLAWWGASGLLLLSVAACFTGYLLPMDQAAYWGTLVRLGIVETIPLAGSLAADVLRGGSSFNAATLTRFHALHVFLLPLLALLLCVPLARAAALALADPAARRRLALTALGLLLGAYALAGMLGAPLEPRAARADSEYVARPEWYFLWLFQLGAYVEAAPWLRSALLPALALGFLAGAPLLPPLAERRRVAIALGAGLAVAGLSGLSLHADRALPPRPSYEAALATRADAVWREECVSCHGRGGRGDGGQAKSDGLEMPDFTDAEFWSKASDATMEETIRNGKGKDMPAFGKKLAADEIGALVSLVRQRFAR
ncbi:MAG: cytochrome b N-terminal domain-containing protein [Vicinamibacteria bacterium]